MGGDRMCKKKIKTMGYLMSLFLAGAVILKPTAVIQAAEPAELYIQAQNYDEKENTQKLSCMIRNGENITNGKLRIYYDEEKAQLTEAKAGDALKDAMTEINDCLTGNKEPGELVEVFASAENILSQGSLLDLEIQLKDGVKKGDEIVFEIQSEKLAGDRGDVEAIVTESVYVVGEGVKEEENSQKGPGSNKNPDGSLGNKNSDFSKKSSSKTAKDVKTADETRTGLYGLAGMGALGIAGLSLGMKRKRR